MLTSLFIRRRGVRRRLPSAALVALTASTLTLAAAPAAVAQHQPRPAKSGAGRAVAPGRAAARGPLSAAQGAALARRTGHRVAVTAMTTATSATTANPDGSFTVTESAQPARAWQHGRWAALNASLRRQPGGRLAPAVTTNGLTLSGGGNSTLAVMTSDARTLTLTWPGTLPDPTVSGATATYANVLPGVDLVVITDTQGGFADILVVHSAAAAQNPALASIQLGVSTSGLVLSEDSAGDLSAAIGTGTPAVITAQAPLIWDSTPPPAGMATVTAPDGTILAAGTGEPAYSSVTAPGAAAAVAAVPVSLSSSTLTLSPPASVLTGPDITYPVYIDPTWHNFASSSASAWTQVDSGFPTTSYWHESSDLQAGACPVSLPGGGWCYDPATGINIGVTRSFLVMPMPSQLTPVTDINYAELDMTENWAPSCTKTSIRLYTTSGISSGTTWNNQPTWSSSYSWQDAAYGYSGCGYFKNDITWDVTSTVKNAVTSGWDGQTWGLRAADESDQYAWKQFWSGSSNLTLTVTYNYMPNYPTSLSTSPGGSCHTSSTDPAQIGNDDVTFSAYASDNDDDNNLTTRYQIYNPTGGTPVYDSGTASPQTGNKTYARLTVTRQQFYNFNQNGQYTPYTYYWQAETTDEFNLVRGWSEKCWFTYNPLGPQAPTITGPTSPVTLGTQAAVTFTAPSGCSPTTTPCPVSYTYQLGVSPPVTVSPSAPGNGTWNTSTDSWSGSITITHYGQLQLAAYGTSPGGNPGEVAYFPLKGSLPNPPYPDGYLTNGSYPDLLTTGTNASVPSLWLSTGSGDGTLNPPLDIGSMGTTVNSGAPASDGPADWASTLILHGNLTGEGIQDVAAYYPATGNGLIIGGNGDQSPLIPSTDNTHTITTTSGTLADPSLCASTCDYPIDLVAAGDASQQARGGINGIDDLIGIQGDTTNGYELNLYTSLGNPGQYSLSTLTTQAPGTGTSWKNFTLATAQPGCYPGHMTTTTCNPANVVLFALNNNSGALWESTSPAAISGAGNWTRIGVPWGSSPPTLLSADINSHGSIELWACAGGSGQASGCTSGTLTAYTLASGTLTTENSQPYAGPYGEWPLTDGSSYDQGSSATTAIDTITGNTASLTGGTGWGHDDYFGADILDHQNFYLAPPSNTIPSSNTTPKISLWFKTTTPDQILASVQASPLSSGPTIPGGYDPVLYIGTDGKLYAEWWNASIDPIVSPGTVDDGLWHHAILTGYPNGQSLYLDNQPSIYLPGSINGNMANFTIGGGYIGGGWPTESHYQQNGNTGYSEYFKGHIADVIYSYPGGP